MRNLIAYLSGLWQQLLRNRTAAIQQLERVESSSPFYLGAQTALGVIYTHRNDHANALETADRILAQFPKDATALKLAAWSSLQTEQFERAAAYYDQAIESNPKDVDALIDAGYALSCCQRWPNAERRFHQALEIQPRNARAHFLLGCALVEQGNLAAAEREHQSLKPIDPNRAQELAGIIAQATPRS